MRSLHCLHWSAPVCREAAGTKLARLFQCSGWAWHYYFHTVLVHYLNGSPLDWSLPEFKDTGPNCGRVSIWCWDDAGARMLAVWLALSLYTAAFIAEIVRAGILAVIAARLKLLLRLGSSEIYLAACSHSSSHAGDHSALTSQYLNLQKTHRWRLLLLTQNWYQFLLVPR